MRLSEDSVVITTTIDRGATVCRTFNLARIKGLSPHTHPWTPHTSPSMQTSQATQCQQPIEKLKQVHPTPMHVRAAMDSMLTVRFVSNRLSSKKLCLQAYICRSMFRCPQTRSCISSSAVYISVIQTVSRLNIVCTHHQAFQIKLLKYFL